MKRKFLSFVLAFCLILPCSFALTACGETKLEKSDYAEAYAGVEAAYGYYMNAGSSALSLNVEDSDLTTIDRENQMHRMGTACVQFVIFLKNLCENDTFELSDGFQDTHCLKTLFQQHSCHDFGVMLIHLAAKSCNMKFSIH